jgi:hypothetical protein
MRELKELFKGSQAGLVLVTAFLDRRAIRSQFRCFFSSPPVVEVGVLHFLGDIVAAHEIIQLSSACFRSSTLEFHTSAPDWCTTSVQAVRR